MIDFKKKLELTKKADEILDKINKSEKLDEMWETINKIDDLEVAKTIIKRLI